MTTVDQGMSVEEIEQVIAERVANAIEAIAIYETKTNMARKSISQTEQQECKLAENANNKRKWEGNHNGQCTVKGKNCKKVGHITRECRNPTAARNQRTHTCYEYGSLGHFKSKCPIVKFQKCVDKKIDTLSKRQAENKRKLNNTSKNTQNQQQPNKRQNTGKAYAAGHGEKKYYGGSKPLCPKCNYHHDGPCPPKCLRCNIVGHLVRNCRRPTNDNQRGTGTSQKVNCYECGNQGHYKRDCPERKNQSHKNQIGGTRAHGYFRGLAGSILRLDNMEFFKLIWYLGAAPVATRAPYRFAPSRMKELISATERAIRQRLYKAQFLALGSSGLVCQEERRVRGYTRKIDFKKGQCTILALPEGSEEFSSHTADARKGFWGAVLMQIEKVISYGHQTVKESMRTTTRLMILGTLGAVVFAHKDLETYVKIELTNVVADALSRKEREPPLRVRALVMTISLDLPKQILNAQIEAQKPENIKSEDVGGDG
ncbi:retrotransposon protein, putative, ty3-gypsy subclass [Tanacetum coccineum]